MQTETAGASNHELPEHWTNTKKLAIQVKQYVAPLQANEVSILRRKCQQFELKQHEFREKFRHQAPFSFSDPNPYKSLNKTLGCPLCILLLRAWLQAHSSGPLTPHVTHSLLAGLHPLIPTPCTFSGFLSPRSTHLPFLPESCLSWPATSHSSHAPLVFPLSKFMVNVQCTSSHSPGPGSPLKLRPKRPLRAGACGAHGALASAFLLPVWCPGTAGLARQHLSPTGSSRCEPRILRVAPLLPSLSSCSLASSSHPTLLQATMSTQLFSP
ncbi:hypothetical protein P7K49_011938 [Saguinus oedipus]|uniref:Uncharacterized protein n=1 Tax=Saguinus oedipus TaxID=9490 RepID=A0ABQ9VST0_SAGOE|nr:hypothetical protein P7K49_011938 [Saguinus oedipus]